MDQESAVDSLSIEERLLIIVMDAVVIAEIFVGMYFASLDQDNLTVVFCRTFFSLLLPTLVIGFLARRRLKSRRAGGA